MWRRRFCLALVAVPLSWLCVRAVPQTPVRPVPATQPQPDEVSAEEAREKAIAERFRTVLETNPRRGTALDRLYGYHVERGSLDQLVGTYADRSAKDARDGVAWMIIGLLESQRGRDAAAVAAFREAETRRPNDAIVSYYLGQSLVLVGQPQGAAEAFERAIARKPIRNDLLDIFQALGRVYQRAQKPEQALAVWTRLEQAFPDDIEVQEQIAATLAEEGQFDQSLPRYEKLAQTVRDPYRAAQFRMEAADLKVRLRRAPQAIADLENLLATLNPDSWLYRDVRRRVEAVFMRSDDLAGLARYYEGWVAKNPNDVEAIARLARSLATQGRMPESQAWLEKAVQRAPTNRELRQTMIDQLAAEHKYAAAAAQYEALDKADPNNPDTLREWGKALLRDTARPEAERQQAALAVWKRLLAKKPNDPVMASQVADLVRSANATADAIALYKKAIELAPDAAQYREYLGEYLHSLKRSDEALATWRPIAEGANRTAKNLLRLAEVFNGFGYKKEAITALADALTLDKDDFDTLLRHAQLLREDGRPEHALVRLEAAVKFASNAEEAEGVLQEQIKSFQAMDKLGDKIDELQRELDAGTSATADRWLRLARYFEANRQNDKATEAVAKAGELDPKSVAVLIAAARITEAGGNLLAAAEANRKLAALDRRFRSEYLSAVARLEQRLGRREQAMQAGRDLLAASPSNPEVYKFFAELCFQLGDQEEGLEALRRSVRANPSEPQGLITLANALAERVRQGEAIELLWRAFDKTNEMDGKLSVIDRLAQLYLENNQFDRLLERLERERREADKSREMAMCIAQAYTSAGDIGTARQQLERLLTENTRDTHLLGQLVTLCEQEGDLAAGVKYQRQLTAAAPTSHDHQLKLAQLLTRSGEADEAADIWVKMVSGQSEAHRTLSSIDQLLAAGKHDSAFAVLSRLLARQPGNWELLYREGAALAARGQSDEAAARFRALLTAKLPDDEMGEILKNQFKQAQKQAALPRAAQSTVMYTATGPVMRDDDSTMPPLTRRIQRASMIRLTVGMDGTSTSAIRSTFYAPSDYGEARMAALAWLYEMARVKDGSGAFVQSLREAKDKAGADQRPVWDWYYLQTLRSERQGLFQTALALSQGTDPAGLIAFLQSLSARAQPAINRPRRVGDELRDTTPPLTADQLAHVVACFEKLKKVKPDWVGSAVTQSVMAELKRSQKEDGERAMYQEVLKDAGTVNKVQSALFLAAERDDLETVVNLYYRLEQLQGPARNASQLASLPTRRTTGALEVEMRKRASAGKFDDVLRLLDLGLSMARRQDIAAPRSVSASRRAATSGPASGMAIGFYGKTGTRTSITLAFPPINEYYGTSGASLVYHAFAIYKEADLLSDLFARFRSQRDATRPGERVYLQLALAYMHWWSDEKEEALAALTEAVRSAPSDHNLLMDVASLREQNNEFDAALTLLDSVTPLDTTMMQRREESALRVAERTGNVDRARQAAERLFGLRLDADKQLELAGKMHRLGMHAEAETVLSRAQRQAGNKTATLVRLMTQYQSQNQAELAVQIARQILRKGPSMQMTSGPVRTTDVDVARSQAITVLARSGQLKEMIERAEAQLKAAPKSVQIHQALIDFYQAANDRAKVKALILQMAELRPDDARLRYQAAEQLQQTGDRDGAIAQYKVAIKLDPSQFSRSYSTIMNLFGQANKYEDLGQVLDEIDMRKISNYSIALNPVTQLLSNPRSRDIGLKLFKKVWEAFPQNRSYMLTRLYDESMWRLPEIYTFAKQAVIPRGDSEIDPWQSVDQIITYTQDGRVEGVLTRLLSLARKQQRLPELRAEVQTALAQRPDWTAGKALLAVIDIQNGNKELGTKEWRELFADPKADVPPLARCVLCQELEFYAGVEDLAVQTLEGGIEDMLRDVSYQFSSHPGRRLAWWYEQLGRMDDAKKLTLRFSKIDRTNPNVSYPVGYLQYQTVSSGMTVAQELLRTGDAVEAVRVYTRLLADRETLDQANQYYGGSIRYDQQVEQGMQAAIKAIKPSTLPSAVNALLSPREVGSKAGPAVDLVILVESQDYSKAALTSLFATAIRSMEKSLEYRKEVLARLAELVTAHPADLSVQTAAALAALALGPPDDARPAVDRLVKLVESMPLEPLPPNGRANARQRAEALQQVPLWLVARECLRPDRSSLRAAGESLAARAAAAARRQGDPLMTAAVLREWGQLALDGGDRAKAEALWGEIVALTMPKPNPPKPATAPAPPPPVPAQPPARGGGSMRAVFFTPAPQAKTARGASNATPPPAARGNVPVLTVEQFQQAYNMALLAAEKNLGGLSLRTMNEAVRGGPPIITTQSRRSGGGPLRQRIINGTQYYVEDTGEPAVLSVDESLLNLVPKWRTIRVPPAEIYEVVAAAVLPAARPAEVFLHAEGQTFQQVYIRSPSGSLTLISGVLDEGVEDRGLASLLADVAVEAGKADDLRARAEARANQPLGELSAKVLLVTLARRAKDDARAAELFQALGERLKKDSQQGTNDRITAVMLPAFADAKYTALLSPFIEKAAENYATGNNALRASELRFKLADHRLMNHDEAGARTQFKAVEALGQNTARNAYDVHMPLARQYLKVGWAEDALRELALYADNVAAVGTDPRANSRRVEPTVEDFPRLVRLLLEMPAAKRYEALKAWSLPTAGRKSIRYLVGLTPPTVPPSAFVKLPAVPVNQVVSTMLLLAEAAKQAGTLDALTADADKFAADGVENAGLFQAIVHLVRADDKNGESAVKSFADAARQRLTTRPEPILPGERVYDYESRQPAPVHPSDLLFASLCLARSAFAAHGESILGSMHTRAVETQNLLYTGRIQAELDRIAATRAGAPDALANGLPPRWLRSSAQSVWFAQNGYAVQASGDQLSALLFDTPLTGTFEVSVDFYQGQATEGGVGYAGVASSWSYGSPLVWPVGRHEQVYLRQRVTPRNGEFNRLTVQVSPGKVRYMRNGQLHFEDTDPLPTSPWLMLTGEVGHRPVFRNFVLTGQPVVHAEVKLTDGDSLGGWLADIYGGTLPQRLLPREIARNTGFDPYGNSLPADDKKEKVYDWQAKNGEIVGRKLPRPADRPAPSRLAYFRPLRAGETLRYEFYYDPGQTLVHPSLGRLAFLLEPDGVRLHWLPDKTADDWTGLAGDNAIDDPTGRRGGKLPLKDGDWNAVTLTTTADGVRIDLNGTAVYEAKLGAEVERTFGLFHYRDRTATRARNVVLSGAWPKAIPSADDVALTARSASPVEASVRRRQIGERYFATEAGDVVARARSLAPAARYKILADWVLPTDSRPVFLLAGVTKPQDVLGVVDQAGQPAGQRVILGGRFEAPCLEMVAAAKDAGLLDELADRLTRAEPPVGDDLFRRCTFALLAVVRAAQGRDADAADSLKQLKPLAEALEPDAPGSERWPDLIAVLGTLGRPALHPPAGELAQAMNHNLDKSAASKRTFEDYDWWLRTCRAAQAAQVLTAQASPEVPFAHWASVVDVDAVSRGLGLGVPHWIDRNGTVTHFPGHRNDYLVFRTPLRGDFEVSCELRLQAGHEAHVVYGGYHLDLARDRTSYKLHTTIRNNGRDTTVKPPLPASATDAYQFQLAVKDGWLRLSVDGREISTEQIGREPAPWLMLHCSHQNTGEVRGLTIRGAPTIPTAVDLLAGDELGLWRPYLGSMGQNDARYSNGPGAWVKRGEELYGYGRKSDPMMESRYGAQSFPESAIYYQRPIIEDGVIEYEFFYDADRVQTHPALDRLVFLLEPDGVRLHWLTDGVNEKSGVAADNATDEPGNRRGPSRLPLKPKAWNKVRLAVVGDTLKLALNGVDVYERPIEPTNQRLFGVFHNTDRTEARVRSMTYSGDWPKHLPANDRLFERKK